MNKDDVAMEAMSAVEKTREGRDDSVITGGGIIVEVYQGFPTGVADVVFEFFQEDWSGGFVARARSVLTGMDGVVGAGFVH
jgi:hypothetical protein